MNAPDSEDAFFTGLVFLLAGVVLAAVAVILWSWYAFLVRPPLFVASEGAEAVAASTLLIVGGCVACYVIGVVFLASEPWLKAAYRRVQGWVDR